MLDKGNWKDGGHQTERAYQKQPTIFQNKKRVLWGETGKEKLAQYYENIGLGFKILKETIEGTYIDRKYPFAGKVPIRGWVLPGVVTKMKMQRTIVICQDSLHYICKYNHFEKHHKNKSAHLSPASGIGDIVTVGKSQPLCQLSQSTESPGPAHIQIFRKKRPLSSWAGVWFLVGCSACSIPGDMSSPGPAEQVEASLDEIKSWNVPLFCY
ncbi:40S ribosomal protein S11-like [Otolemur garnettii]|uniref:40S ribosomal protein S11-like n=1 Tax=Otolemur garnettii TaxID=30611 RepID=UPI000644142C|nr:40S ribosomal protein S11-like [Otolemur garnettii]